METFSVFSPSCRSPFPCAGFPPSLATAWHSHEVFVKCLAVVHKTDVLTLSIARRIRRRRHARMRSPATGAIGASAGSLDRNAICSDASESARSIEPTGRRLPFSLPCTMWDGRAAQDQTQLSLALSFDAREVGWHGANDPGGSSHARTRPLIV